MIVEIDLRSGNKAKSKKKCVNKRKIIKKENEKKCLLFIFL